MTQSAHPDETNAGPKSSDSILLEDQPMAADSHRDMFIDVLADAIMGKGQSIIGLWASRHRGRYFILRQLHERLEPLYYWHEPRRLRLVPRNQNLGQTPPGRVRVRLTRAWAWRQATNRDPWHRLEYDFEQDSGAVTPVITVRPETVGYETREQVRAGLARSITSELANRLPRPERERLWFDLNLRRTDPIALKRRILASYLPTSLTGSVIAIVLGCAAALILGRSLLASDGQPTVTDVASIAGVVATLIGYVLQTRRRDRDTAQSWAAADSLSRPMSMGLLGDGGSSQDPYLLAWDQDMFWMLDIASASCKIVLLLDDLDQCGPDMAASVLRATQELPMVVVVAAFNPAVVSSQLEARMPWLASRVQDDPAIYGQLRHLGWHALLESFDLSVRLPVISDDQLNAYADVLTHGSPPYQPSGELPAPPPVLDPPDLDRLQACPPVRDALTAAIHDLPDRSHHQVRALINLWRFYVTLEHRRRFLTRAANVPPDEATARELARLTEIASRWPWLLDLLGSRVGGGNGRTVLLDLLQTCDDDEGWDRIITRTGPSLDSETATGLRAVLRRGGNDAALLAELAGRYV